MIRIYSKTAAVTEMRPTANAMGAAVGSKIILLLFISLFMLVSGKTVGQTITSISPSCAKVGDEIIIAGTNYNTLRDIELDFSDGSTGQAFYKKLVQTSSETEIKLTLTSEMVQNRNVIWIGVHNMNNGGKFPQGNSNRLKFSIGSNTVEISGLTQVCLGQNNTNRNIEYSVPNEATSYIWTLPTGVTRSQSSPVNSNSIKVDFPNTGVKGDIVVSYETACGTVRGRLSVEAGIVFSPEGKIEAIGNLEFGQPAVFNVTSNIITNGHASSYKWSMITANGEVPLNSNTQIYTFNSLPLEYRGIKVEIFFNNNNTCYSTASPFILTNIITPLPVELISFNAQRHTQGVNLTWVTASELDNKGFEVQVSTDSRNFTTIGFVESKVGTTSLKQYYNFLDTKAVSGTRYYRLKQIDFDGTTSFSAIRSVALNGNHGVVAAYPNPFDDVVTVTLNGTEARQVQVVLVDVMGKILLQRTEETAGNSISVDMTSVMTKGMYMLHVLDNNAKHTFKLMKR